MTTLVNPFMSHPAAGGPVEILDSFNRANNPSSMGNTDTGETWVPNSGSWGITSNRAVAFTATQATTVVESGVSDCTIQFTMPTFSDSGVCFRSTDNDNHFLSNGTTLFRKQAGTFNNIGTFSSSFVSGDVLKVVLIGTSIQVFRNGSSVLAVTSSFNQTATKHGLRTNGNPTFDDFSITA